MTTAGRAGISNDLARSPTGRTFGHLREIAEGLIGPSILDEEVTLPGLEFDEDGEMIEMDDAAVEEAIRQAMLESSDDDETGTDPEVEEKPE